MERDVSMAQEVGSWGGKCAPLIGEDVKKNEA